MKTATLTLVLLSFSFMQLFAQMKPCYTDEAVKQKIIENPEIQNMFRSVEKQARKWLREHPQLNNKTVVTIPTVVHVVYNTGLQNIADSQIFSQIDVLNEDYRLLNDTSMIRPVFQSFAGDAKIEFCLAQRDPDGNPTTGITRTYSTVTDWGCNDEVKFDSLGGKTGWDPHQYLNIWVCNLNCANGYSYYPGIPDEYDGVVVHYYVFGRIGYVAAGYNGRTCTHEIGHWLNLYHPFYDECAGNTAATCALEGDKVCDTPQDSTTWYCLETNTCIDYPVDYPDQYENYMNYTDDACQAMFTHGQIDRITAALYTYRASLITSLGCVPPATNHYDAALVDVVFPTQQTCHQTVEAEITIGNGSTEPLTSLTLNYRLDNDPWQQDFWTGSLANSQFENVILPPVTASPGLHYITVYSSDPNGHPDDDPVNDTLIIEFDVMDDSDGLPLPFAEGFESGDFPPDGWYLDPPNHTVQWERTTAAGGYDNSPASAMFDNFYDLSGQKDGLVTPCINLLTATGTKLYFDYAYMASASATYWVDTLSLFCSVDCGDNWIKIWEKGGADLATAPHYGYVNPFVPLSDEWETDTISLAVAEGNSLVLFKFQNTNDWGAQVYIDNINVDGLVDIDQPAGPGSLIRVYPTLVDNSMLLNVDVPFRMTGGISFIDISGRILQTNQLEQGLNRIGLLDIPQGIYFYTICNNGFTVKTGKIVKTK